MRRDAKQIVDRAASAIAAASIYNADDMRQAAKHIRSPAFSADAEERDVIEAFAALLEKRAERKERILREAFGA